MANSKNIEEEMQELLLYLFISLCRQLSVALQIDEVITACWCNKTYTICTCAWEIEREREKKKKICPIKLRNKRCKYTTDYFYHYFNFRFFVGAATLGESSSFVDIKQNNASNLSIFCICSLRVILIESFFCPKLIRPSNCNSAKSTNNIYNTVI